MDHEAEMTHDSRKLAAQRLGMPVYHGSFKSTDDLAQVIAVPGDTARVGQKVYVMVPATLRQELWLMERVLPERWVRVRGAGGT